MNETIRIAEQMLTEADGLMARAKKIIVDAEEREELKKRLQAALKTPCVPMSTFSSLASASLHEQIAEAFLKAKLNDLLYSVPPVIVSLDGLACGGFLPSNFHAVKVPDIEQKAVEVKRHAKVGETIKIVNPQHDYNCTAKDYSFGDTFGVLGAESTNGVKISGKRDRLCFVKNAEYVVLEPAPLKPEVGMWVRRKRDGKMLCVVSHHDGHEVGVYVAASDGNTLKASRATSKFSQKWRCLMEDEYTIVPNYAPTPADMLEVIQ